MNLSKNSVLPIMAACLLTDETCTIDNVPEISDVLVMTQLLSKCGVKIQKAQKKLKITEIPGDEPQRIGGERKIRVFKTGLTLFLEIFKNFFNPKIR